MILSAPSSRSARSSLRAALIGLALVAQVLAVAACEGDKPRPSAAGDAAVAPAPARPTVVFLTAKGEVPVRVDIARTPSQRERGLMWVEHMDEMRGMVFLMGEPERRLTFWMKNTYIPLDMIFVNKAKVVVGIVENAEPLTLSGRAVDSASSYVVEVNGGWSKRHGVTAGTKVRFEAIE